MKDKAMNAYIYDAVRTTRGKAKPDGGLASLKPEDLVARLVAAIFERTRATPSIDALLVGAVGQVGAQGGHIALVSKFRAELPDETAAISLNNYCVSGLTAVGQAAAMVTAGQCETAMGGGVEMMSRVPFMGDNADYYSDTSLPARSRYLPVALAADRLAEDLGISREDMDQAALISQQRTADAEGTPLVASRIAVNGLEHDECARATTLETLGALEPAFVSLAEHYPDVLGRDVDHRHTVAHAPPMCDGAGLALVGREGAFDASPRARIVASVEAGGDPAASLTAGLVAMDRALAQAGLTLDDMDRIEFMEAFAVSIVNFIRERKPDLNKVNVGGGSMAKGHPMGASGAILLSSLLDALDEVDGRYGLVTMTGAAGVGSAMIVERLGG
jgi:acetyl-CoA C-acetyltransferase/acetyl-CoA acyltransferase